MAEVALDDLERVGPGGIRMRKIVRPHDVVLTPELEILAAYMIVEETGINLIFDEAARIARDRRRVLFFEPIVVIIPLLKHPGHPAALVFYGHYFELGVALENTVENDFKQTIGDVHQLEIDTAAVALDTLSAFILVVAVPGQYVEADRRVKFLAR